MPAFLGEYANLTSLNLFQRPPFGFAGSLPSTIVTNPLLQQYIGSPVRPAGCTDL